MSDDGQKSPEIAQRPTIGLVSPWLKTQMQTHNRPLKTQTNTRIPKSQTKASPLVKAET